MLDFSTTTQTRKSIREYLPEPLSQAELDAVLKECAACAVCRECTTLVGAYCFGCGAETFVRQAG